MRRKNFLKLFSLLLSLSVLLSGCGMDLSVQQSKDYNNTITMLDVGQASCTLIESNGQFCLIDAGRAGGNTDIVSYLFDRSVEKIDLLILTHFHYDHTSEALDIIRNFDIDTVLIPSLSQENIPDTYFYKSLVEDGKNGYYNLEYAHQGWEYKLGDGLVAVLADTFNSENINNTSVITSYTLNDFVYVNMGDTESDREEAILDLMPENISFLTAGHHGSRDSTSVEFLQKLNPDFVGISCGKDNDYGHPHGNMLKRLTDMGIPYEITADKGNIVCCMETYTVVTE